MDSPHVVTSPPPARRSGQFTSPVTSPAKLRNRHTNLHEPEPELQPDNSPSQASTFSESAPTNAIRLNEAPRATFRNVFASSPSISSRKLVVRSDPSLLTCFDPLDKELYDLWAPKN